MQIYSRFAIAILLSALLSACASTPQRQQNGPVAHLDDLQHWRIEGKLSLQHLNKSQQANIRWDKHKQNYQILLFGPLGQGKVSISKRGKRVELVDGKAKHRAKSAEDLLAEVSGINMPVSLLNDWILGRAAPNLPIHDAQDNGDEELLSFSQAGWYIEILRRSELQGVWVPDKIRIQNPENKLTLIIKRWTVL